MNQQFASNDLIKAFLSLKSEDEVRRFLLDICTPAELRAFSQRLEVAKLLRAGEMSYRDIAAETSASVTTVGRVARFLHEEPHQGYHLVFERLKK